MVNQSLLAVTPLALERRGIMPRRFVLAVALRQRIDAERVRIGGPARPAVTRNSRGRASMCSSCPALGDVKDLIVQRDHAVPT